jgi:potassium/hydrogen antiporter
MANSTAIMIDHVIYILILILGLGILFGKLAGLLRLPDVALFLAAGMIAGQGLPLISETSSSFMNQFIVIVGSALILSSVPCRTVERNGNGTRLYLCFGYGKPA